MQLFAGFFFLATDMFLVGMIVAVSVQFIILSNDTIRQKDQEGDFPPLIDRHCKVLEEVQQINDIFSGVLLMNFLRSSIVICISCFLAATTGKFIGFASATLIHLGQIYSFCYFGNMLEKSSQKTADAIISSNHNEKSNKKIRDALMMMTIKANKPCELRAWKFTKLNFPTLTIILNTAYSYFTLLMSFAK
jgi:7tm Odorant receptor